MISLNRKSPDIFEQFPTLKSIQPNRFPTHVLIIPDGDVRWATKFNKLPIYGHRKGAQILKKVIRALDTLPIETTTVWGFSADNWKRSKEEISGIMTVIEETIGGMRKELIEKNIRFFHLGRRDRIPKSLKKILEDTQNITKENTGKKFAVAVDFGGVDQEMRIIRKIQLLPKNTEISLGLLEKLRDCSGVITPADLIIRTSGEKRTSDLGWLAQNAEFYSIEKFLPESDTSDFIEALVDFSKRERRFGGRPNYGNTPV